MRIENGIQHYGSGLKIKKLIFGFIVFIIVLVAAFSFCTDFVSTVTRTVFIIIFAMLFGCSEVIGVRISDAKLELDTLLWSHTFQWSEIRRILNYGFRIDIFIKGRLMPFTIAYLFDDYFALADQISEKSKTR